ncbi:hypothetical protein [Neobacillus rhizophilus]|uniref:Uncharacterized protein n=1 Tax=Neobacillus rhizophilus TaxID=2833579 RepID=A0A942U8U8_9BACI|nr:hypothetical protein [Neobacillus rhizophilus]MBS4213619.1 hypothetical protein [Neobacillus rhizophilus]
MWWKNKSFLISCSVAIMFFSLFSFSYGARAETTTDMEGFIIEADRVVGTGMSASIVERETSATDKKPMLQIKYKSATIYGMKLTKRVNSGNGPISIVLNAKGPVTVYGMTVDISAISFKGACIHAAETVPQLGMENVTMVAHYMESDDSVINQLTLKTVSGNAGPEKPDQLQILQDLSKLPLEQLKKEIEKIMSGHLPLTCADSNTAGASEDLVGKITDPIQDVIGGITDPLSPVTKPLEPVLKPLDPVVSVLDPVLKPVETVLDPVLQPLEPALNPLKPALKPLDPVVQQLEPVIKPLEPVINGTVNTANQTVQTVCSKLQSANGVITKELGLQLIDEALAKKVDLNQVCPTDTTLTNQLVKIEESLLNTLGISKLLGLLIPNDTVSKLTKMRDEIVKKPDGSVIYSQ